MDISTVIVSILKKNIFLTFFFQGDATLCCAKARDQRAELTPAGALLCGGAAYNSSHHTCIYRTPAHGARLARKS